MRATPIRKSPTRLRTNSVPRSLRKLIVVILRVQLGINLAAQDESHYRDREGSHGADDEEEDHALRYLKLEPPRH
jgi:hypothetical protein